MSQSNSERATLPDVIDPDAPIFTISVAAALADMHPQTLRSYDRIELVVPKRTKGGGRRYTPRDVQKLRSIQHLSQVEGINLNGIKRIVEMGDEIDTLQKRVEQLTELLSEVVSEDHATRRVFTATAHGWVHPGRSRHDKLALLPAREVR